MSALRPLWILSVFGGVLALAPVITALPVYAANSDFDGDGRDDLAIGAAGETFGDNQFAGAVNVLYGTSAGVSSTGDQFWHQNVPNVEGAVAGNEDFGRSLANGDFNGDGRADLAIGVPGDTVSSIRFAGAVNVLYGSSSKLTASGDQLWTQDSPGVLDAAEQNSEDDEDFPDQFGYALAVGDFNNDGRDDLAIGAQGENVGLDLDAGAVNVLYGSSSGLSANGDQFWTQHSSGIESGAEGGDHFGTTLAAGDFDNDGFADLAVGVPGEGFEGKDRVGAVNIIHGSSSGLTSSGDQFWTQDSSGILDTAESEDKFGSSLAGGDFDNDGFADLAVGVPSETIQGASESQQGAVNVLYGSSSGLSASGDEFWHQDFSGIESGAEDSDFFGFALAAGDFDNDGHSDLAVGVPSEDVHGVEDIGAVNVIYGVSSGLSATGDQFWTQDSPNIRGVAGNSDQFGFSLGTGDYNGDSRMDLAVGATTDKVGTALAAGAVNVLYGSSPNGLITTNNQVWTQDSSGVEDAAEPQDYFGWSLSRDS